MSRLRIAAAAAVAAWTLSTGQAHAQTQNAGSALVQVTVIPGGATFFTEGSDTQAPSFGNYELGAALAYNFTRHIGVEGEVTGGIGIEQDLQFGGVTSSQKTPHLLNYNGSVVVSVPNQSSVVPYVAAGVGGLSVFERSELDIAENETFLTGNVGGGIKWHAGRWGLRGDYRFIAVQSKDDAPEFFGRETRYGHRVYGGVVFNFTR